MRAAALAALLAVVVLPGWLSAEGVDELFNDPQADSVAADQGGELLASVNATFGPRIRGRSELTAGVLAGYGAQALAAGAPWPPDPSAYLSFSSVITLDARPIPEASFLASASTEYPGFTPSVKELFVEYSVGDRLFIKAGRQIDAWGHARTFKQTDLYAGGEGGFSLRSFAQIGGIGITLAAVDLPAWHASTAYPGFADLAYLARIEVSSAGAALHAAARYRAAEGLSATAAIKTAFMGIDLFHESLGLFRPGGSFDYSSVSGVFWERGGGDLVIMGEHLWSAATGHRAAVSVGARAGSFGGIPIKLGATWEHSFHDGSGTALIAAVASPLPSLSLSLGLPLLYGTEGSTYVGAAKDPAKRKIAVAAGASLSISF